MLIYCNIDIVGHGMYSSIVTLTISVMVYTHLLYHWQLQSWYVLTYYNTDNFGHDIYSPIVALTVSVMVYTYLL
jgi:hypothetical protein